VNLPVLKSAHQSDEPWFSQGLRFTCTQCGNCCSGPPGFVWVSDEELAKLAEFLGTTTKQVLRKYCRKVGRQIALKEIKNKSTGGHDCIFIKEIPSGSSRQKRRICSVYSVRPLQCRTWPFWEGNLSSLAAWNRAAKTCLGMNRGESFSRTRIERLRDAEVWPHNPPTSKAD
jgi:uncharacterized protein